jgi:hypothetical protein
MGDRDPSVTLARRQQALRAREMTVIYSVMVSVMVLIVIQFLLLMIAVEGFLGGRTNLLLPSAAGSGACFAAACRLIRYVAAAKSRELPCP